MNKKIDKSNVENILDLTSTQQGMLFHYISDHNSKEYQEQLSLTITGDVKIDLLQRAWDFVIESNEMLRTIFRWKGIDKPVQIVLKKYQVVIQSIDLENEVDKHRALENIKLDDLNNRIDITRETLRIYLCKLDDYKYEMIISNHHILYDGWSNGIILKELMEAYECLYENKVLKRINKTKFGEFIKYTKNLDKKEQKDYWVNYVDKIETKEDWFNGKKENGSYKEILYKLETDKAYKLKEFTKENKISLAAILYSTWGVLIQKLSNSNEVVFGTTVSGRPESIKSVDNLVGLFINTIPLIVKSEGNCTFINLIREIDLSLNERKEFENTSLIDIKEYCGLNANEELFNSIVTIENYPLDLNLNKRNLLTIEGFSIVEKTNYNMSLEILTFNDIEFKFTFNSEVIDEHIIKRLGSYFEILIDSLLNNKYSKISDIELLGEKERNQILYEFNDTKTDYPKDRTIQEVFEAQVEKTPDNIAVVFEGTQLTYKELNEKSNQLARILRSKGVKADSLVGIMVEKSLEMIIGILGILKAGGAYLPIDPSYPKERIEYMLGDSESHLLLSTENLSSSLDFNGQIIDLFNEDLFKGDSSNLEKINNSNDLAYVIYTSGTTGKPKGVMCEHKNIVRLVKNTEYIEFKKDDRILQTGSMVFDASTFEVWGVLLNGLELYLAKDETIIVPELLEKFVTKNKITILWLTSELFNQMAEANVRIFKKLRYLLAGGDVLSPKYINLVRKECKNLKVINGYGPTENTTFSTTYLIEKEYLFRIPIGKPISNSKAYIVDKNNRLMPVGGYGELCVSGDGLARGYLNRPELTAKKFVDNPFESGKKMYKTGDLARWLPDGNIDFLGRIDNQVKIRGFRIELGEIENRLLQHEDVKEAVVVVKENKEKEKYISAYIVSEKEISELNLKKYLKGSLPDYMVPAYFMQLEKMPLTHNGKLDRRVLPEPDLDIILREYEAPRNKLEEKLSKVWSEVLGVEKIGINDNFFELGGHSLKATVIRNKVYKELNREIPLKELFEKPTIKELSVFIQNTEENPYSKIEKVGNCEYYEASPSQKRMYMVQQFEKNSVAYNMPVAFELDGEVDKERIDKTFKRLVTRHESLRTYFETIEDEIVQKVDYSYEFKLSVRKDNNEIENIINKFVRPFELERAPLFRVELIENNEKTYLLIDMHHIISDGVSMSILIKEFSDLYDGKSLEPLRLQYKDFAAWQNNFMKSEEMKDQQEYWINRFNDEIPVLSLPYDYERPVMQSFEGDDVSFKIDEKNTKALRKLAKETGTTMHMMLLSSMYILLSKYSGQEDLVIGTPIAGRPHADLHNIMGMFVNTLALRNKPKKDKNYLEFLKEVKDNSLKAYENQSYQLESLIENLDIVRDTSRNPLFDVMFNMVDTVNNADIQLDGLLLKQYIKNSNTSKFDLTFNVLEKDNILEFNLEYCSKLFKKETIERLSNHYIKLLRDITNNVEIKISDIELLGEKERKQILYEFNNTKTDYPKDRTIQEVFEAQVEKTPDNIAVVFESTQLTYKELNEKSNQLARILRSKGVKADSLVGIMVEKSPEMIVGIMAILKAGGAYLPIDPSYPKERIEYMLEDSESQILLSTENLSGSLDFNGQVVDLFNEDLFKGDSSNLVKVNNSNDLAYVIYTSGTTGKPKGVMVEHKSVINTLDQMERKYPVENNDVYLLKTNYVFDVSVTELFGWFFGNGVLAIMNENDQKDINSIIDSIEKYKVTHINFVPSILNLFNEMIGNRMDKVKSLKYVFAAGEELKANIIFDFYNKFTEIQLENLYGPTEASIYSTMYSIDKRFKGDNVSIGTPIQNTKAYIMNNNQLNPIGVAGELCLGGEGLARGYLNRPELTSEKFVDNPFEAGKKMYKTGDLARWLPDGNIEFLGRIDNQVKIRGFRIELGEIENRLLQHEDLKEAAVVVKENKEKEKYISAYVVSDKDISEINIRNYLKENLPDYMVPAYFVQLEKMPLTHNGKLDRRNLPEPSVDANLSEFEAARNETEEKLSKIWSEVLGAEKVGINDNFFELGGHSLKATVIINKVYKELNKQIPLKELFKSPTIKDLSRFIQNTEESPYAKIEKVGNCEYYEASPSQKRMYMVQQFEKNSVAYNMPVAFELQGKVDKERIEETFKKLVTRHESLRTYFETIENEIVQKVDYSYEFKLSVRKDNDEIENIINKFVRPFELERAPLFRVELIENNEKTYLLIDMHHIISDGVSMSIVIKEFSDLYDGKSLEPLKLQYKDFAAWQNNFLKLDEMKKQEEYWINRFNDEIPVLNLPYDYERPVMQSFEGDDVSFKLDEKTTKALRKLTKETGTTMHMVLLSSMYILLSKYSGQEDIVVGTPIAGRPHADLQNIMGMFVNTLALRNKPKRDKNYLEFLKEVKENSLKAYENQSYQLESLIENLDIVRDTSRNPLFDVMFNMVDTVNDADIQLDGLLLKQYIKNNKISKFDLTFNVLEKDNIIEFNLEYCSKLFKKETIERLSNHYIKLLRDITNNVAIKISDIQLLSEKERNQILYDFNDTKTEYPKDRTIQEVFEAKVEKAPDNIAVVFEGTQLTYTELNEKSNQLARVLRNKGVKADSIIGIMVERSPEMIIGIMGILKAGGAYLPIDPNYPKERIEFMLNDSESHLLLSTEKLSGSLDYNGQIIDLFNKELFEGDSSNLEKINNSNDLAYVIYTSGTTGNPKGVMIEHYNLNNFIHSFTKQFIHGFSNNDRILSLTNYVFDVSVCEFFVALTSGAVLIINDKHKTLNPMEIAKLIVDNDVTFTYIPPLLLPYVYEELKGYKIKVKLSKLLVGVEAIRGKILNNFYNLNEDINIVNGYGPTETTICSTFYKVTGKEAENKAVPIGIPAGNMHTYILDKSLNVVPAGVSGEIFISGDGLARGYLNRPELTSEKFVENPFEQGKKMYKTGDLARWLSDGNIEFLGRIDNQVKIRGFRIELGEIENRLLQHEGVKEAVVVVKENKEKEKYIRAYVVSDKEISELNLKRYLKDSLPDYMIPTYFMKLDKMPLTHNGKLDRRALPEPSVDANLSEFEAARNETEEKLSKIWSEVLGVEKIGINDNFFELGGHSLKATVIINKVYKELNKQIPLKELFKSPTIKDLSTFIENTEENPYSKIEKVGNCEYYEASPSQKRMYMVQQFEKNGVAYNMPVAFELDGEVDKERIEETFKKLVTRHESLRTYFETIENEIVQKVDYSYEFKLAARKDNDEIETIINKFVRPFELERAPLFRVELIENNEKTYLLIDMHHIISDGVSMSILIKEFADLYDGKSLEPLKLQYKDFAAWQNNFLKSEEMKDQQEYWSNRFNDEIPVLNLPYDYERPVMQSFEGDDVSFKLEEKTTKALRKLTKETGTTMHMVLLSSMYILLSKYSGQEDIVVGTPIAGRPHADLHNIMGMFVNTLALRNKPEGDKNYLEFLKEVKESSLKAYENQSYQLESLIENLDIVRDTSRNPLFDVMFNMVDTVNDADIQLDGLLLKQYIKNNKISKFDLTFNVLEKDNILEFNLQYCSKLFKKETIERLSNHYTKLLKDITNNIEGKLSDIEILTEKERNQILYDFNDTKTDYPKDGTIQEVFEAQVEKTPDNIAVVFEGTQLTYKELNEKSNQLARILRNKGIKAESLVGIMVERSPEMIIGIMGILKAGGGYLPIDPSYPKERIEYMLKDSESHLLLSTINLAGSLDYNGQIIDLFNEDLFKGDSSNLERINNSNDLAYVIYTSGTTGKPKGVVIEHKSVINTLDQMERKYPVENNDVYLLKTNYVFDVSVTELFGWFFGNGVLAIMNENDQKDINSIIDSIEKYKVTHINFVPSILNLFNEMIGNRMDKVKSLKYVFAAGEELKANIIFDFYNKFTEIQLENLYGPTEASIYSTMYSIDKRFKGANVSIGTPIQNTKAYIMNNNQLNPVGIAGELCIGGEGLARGYLNRPELSSEKFVENPFEQGKKMYKTGDLARWLPDGNIEFLGRIDNQVKIRGFRIELGEIENRLLQHEGVKEAVVVVKENKEKEKYISAYVVSDKEISELNLKRYLKDSLPDYMIPTYFMKLDKMPLTHNGKLDRRALPEPSVDANLSEFEAARNETEEKLSKIWSEVLGVEKVGINDNFFELGGHSLKATVIINKVYKELNKQIPLNELFKKPTIKELSELIENMEENPYSSIKKVASKEYYEASSAQKRMYMLQKIDKDSTAYNMPITFELEGKVDKNKILETFKKLVIRHEALRTCFEIVKGQIVQKVDNSYDFKYVEKKDNEEIDNIISQFVRPFELNKAPLFRVELVESKNKEYMLIDMHHIISDGVSMEILIKDFTALYNGEVLEPLKLQYKDFAAWQNNFLKSEKMKKQEEYWVNRFNDEIPLLNLPYDYERPTIQSFEGDSVSFKVDEITTKKLRVLAKETGATMHMVLLSSVYILLSKYSGQDDIVIGIPIAGRPHADLQNIMGVFVNTLALRNKPVSGKMYLDFLKEVRENSLKAYENQSYQFETLVEKLGMRREQNRSQLFNVMFNMIDSITDDSFVTDGLMMKQYSNRNIMSKFDLSIGAMEKDNILELNFTYYSKVFTRETIEIITEDFIGILNAITSDRNISILDLIYKEMEQTLYAMEEVALEVDFDL
ncbi:non-ribosomal peptide synthetase [Oceanirhabdus sp. W0125-5]|uniref:non-ribosomal peptide synthetase n=1 Tax=Oceanirhabdus sp. W0125-5 TaxID=2999116 RepID=UPI0022F2E15C|nr:non-ribosomal peptide synthetase [Oceanirhabdus sp. W0125-5]WBW96389.1 amino acid adenylation domain-containing protein [Oceanirhabdus sp. W0125-5]